MTVKKIESPHAGYDRYEIEWPGPETDWKVEYRMEGGEWVDIQPVGGVRITESAKREPYHMHWRTKGICGIYLDIYRSGRALAAVRVSNMYAAGEIHAEATIPEGVESGGCMMGRKTIIPPCAPAPSDHTE